MLEQFILKISEIFWSFQGEGLRTGEPSIFIRLAGCSLRCPYCDTKYSWDKGVGMSIQEIMITVNDLKKNYPVSQIVITGGEPFEQDLSDLIEGLKRENFFISIETNGLYYQDLRFEWLSVSPKDVSDYFIHPDLCKRMNEVKLLVNDSFDIDALSRIRTIGNHFIIFLQPEYYTVDKYKKVFNIYEKAQSLGIPNIRIGCQLHKIYDVL